MVHVLAVAKLIIVRLAYVGIGAAIGKYIVEKKNKNEKK